jgi:hypothetical protein
MTARFRYTDDQWIPVAEQLRRHGAVTAKDRDYLNDAARDYHWFREYTEPASDEVKRAKTCFRNIDKHSARLLSEFDILDRLPTKPSRLTSLQIALARDPLNARAEYHAWRKQLTEIQQSATDLARGFRKAAKGTNRSRGDVLDDYLRKLLKFWTARGGHAGKSETSPAVRFILAAARPVIPDLKANRASHFVRDEMDAARARRAL